VKEIAAGTAGCGVLWDMDGVIADTDELHFESWQAVLPDYGIEMTEADHKKTFGMNNKKIITILTGNEPDADLLQEISDRKEAAFRDLARGRVEPMEGVVDWLKRFKSWGCRQAIASSAPQENIETLVSSMDLGKYFNAQVSGFSLPAKPDPAVYLEAASQIGMQPLRCLVVEDAVVGVEGAKAAGMAAIGVTTTHASQALMDADIVVESMEDLDEQAVRKLLAI
jgi:HAD superfamily hydrolase (TIGR01509 family)